MDVLIFDEPVPYADALALQERLLARRIADEIPDTLLVLEHPSVITLGRRGRRDFLLVSDAELERRGVPLVHSSRGGDVTWHGPGQLVAYPIRKLGGGGSHGHLDLLQQTVIRTARAFGVEAFARDGKAGAWTAFGKIAAIGFAMKRWVSFHGLSLNVNCDLAAFELIVGCGLQGESVTSIHELLGEEAPALVEVRERLIAEFAGLVEVDEVCLFPGSDFSSCS